MVGTACLIVACFTLIIVLVMLAGVALGVSLAERSELAPVHEEEDSCYETAVAEAALALAVAQYFRFRFKESSVEEAAYNNAVAHLRDFYDARSLRHPAIPDTSE